MNNGTPVLGLLWTGASIAIMLILTALGDAFGDRWAFVGCAVGTCIGIAGFAYLFYLDKKETK